MQEKELLAHRTMQLINPGVSQFDIFILAAIVSMISAAISILKNCGYIESEIHDKVSRPTWLMKFRLRHLAQQHIPERKLALAVADMLPVAVSELSKEQFFGIYKPGG